MRQEALAVAPQTKEVLAQIEQALWQLPAQEQAIFLNQILAELVDMQADVLNKSA